jgi:hypothetical protein
MLNVCGASCEGCRELGKECAGDCNSIKGKVYWAKMINVEVCPVYKCVDEHGYQSCGDCPQIPCQTWTALKDPSQSEEQHLKSIRERVKLLTSQK